MVIRGYVSGHAAREYAAGRRQICGVTMAEGLKENDKFPEPIITPTTKADNGSHDEDISREDILAKVWQEEVYVLDRTIDVNITRLRKKVGEYGKCIVTRLGYGYCFEYQ